MRLPKITCSCLEVVVKAHNSESKIRSKILLVKGTDVFAVCKGCGKEILVPLRAAPELMNPPLFIKENDKK